MKRIKKLVNMIKEEIESAECYAEKSMEYKVDGYNEMSQKFMKMASEELSHAEILHEIAVVEIEKASGYITPSAEMREKWQLSHNEYVEKTAKIKSYLIK